MYQPRNAVIVHGKWLDNLKKEMSATDFCFICLHHLSDGHDAQCPMIPNPVVLAVVTE